MFSPHAQTDADSPQGNAASKAIVALAIAFLATCLMSCQSYPSSYSQPNYGAYRNPAPSYQATPQGQRVQAPAQNYAPPTYGSGRQHQPAYRQPVGTYSVSNNPVTNTAAAWGQRMQSRNPAFPTSNSSTATRGRRRVPNAGTGIFGTAPQQPPVPRYTQSAPVAAPVAQRQATAPQPYPAQSWQQSPIYPQQQQQQQLPQNTGYPAAPAGYGPTGQTQPAGYSNVAYTPYPGTATAGYGTSGGGSSYTIQKGDSLSAIAQRQGVSLGALMQTNGLDRSSVIHPHQVLTIPGR